MEIPMGYFFQPRDYQLLRFLFRFVTGKSVHDESVIHHHVDIFGDKEPWELFSSSEKTTTHYFFTELKRKSKQGTRFERTVGKTRQATWKGQDKGKPVFDKGGRALLGYKRSFVYKNKKGGVEDGKWLLKEFYLSNEVIKKSSEKYPVLENRKDFVVCRLKRKKRTDNEESKSFEEGIVIPIEDTLQFLDGDENIVTGLPGNENTVMDPLRIKNTVTDLLGNDNTVKGLPGDGNSVTDLSWNGNITHAIELPQDETDEMSLKLDVDVDLSFSDEDFNTFMDTLC